MKSIIYNVFMVFLFNTIIAFTQNYNLLQLESINCDFKGIVKSNKSVLCYGTNGVIYYSDFELKNWNKKTISPFINIYKIISLNNDYYGIANSDFNKRNSLFKIDSLFNLNKITESDNEINDIFCYNNSIFILNNDAINKFDLQLNLIEKVCDLTDKYINLSINKDTIILLNKSKITKISLTNLSKYESSISINISKSTNFQYKFIENYHYILVDSMLYKSSDNCNSFKLINKYNSAYTYYKNEYIINSKYDSVNPIKIDFIKKNESIVLENISKNQIQYNVDKYNFVDLLYLDGNKFVAIGDKMVIQYSTNGGVDWEFANYKYDINPNYYFNYNEKYRNNYIETIKFSNISSSDNQITWKPQQYIDNVFYKKLFDTIAKSWTYKSSAPYCDGKNSLVIFNSIYYDQNPYSYIYFKNNGEVINPKYDKNFLGQNFGAYYIIESKENINIFYPDNYQTITLNYDKNNLDTLKKIFFIDSVKISKIIKIDENEFLGIGHYRFTNVKDTSKNFNYRCLMYSKDNCQTWVKKNKLFSTNMFEVDKNDNSFYLNNYFYYFDQIGMKGMTIIFDSLNKPTQIPDSIHVSLRRLDIKTGEDLELFKSDSISLSNILYFKNQLYILGTDCIFVSTFNSNYINWKRYNFKLDLKNSIGFQIVNNLENKPIIKLYRDNGNYFNKEKFFYLNDIDTNQFLSSIIEDTEDQNYFYSYPPFPTPSINEVKSLIYWDMSFNIVDSDISVYDIYGNKVASKDKISINKLNSYSGYLSWDCSSVGTGIYMIQIKYGTNTHNFRAMVVR
jgi:hypothetical protein